MAVIIVASMWHTYDFREKGHMVSRVKNAFALMEQTTAETYRMELWKKFWGNKQTSMDVFLKKGSNIS